jgi:hypothetical protein
MNFDLFNQHFSTEGISNTATGTNASPLAVDFSKGYDLALFNWKIYDTN